MAPQKQSLKDFMAKCGSRLREEDVLQQALMGLASQTDGQEWTFPRVEVVPVPDATWVAFEAPDGRLCTDSGVRMDATYSILREAQEEDTPEGPRVSLVTREIRRHAFVRGEVPEVIRTGQFSKVARSMMVDRLNKNAEILPWVPVDEWVQKLVPKSLTPHEELVEKLGYFFQPEAVPISGICFASRFLDIEQGKGSYLASIDFENRRVCCEVPHGAEPWAAALLLEHLSRFGDPATRKRGTCFDSLCSGLERCALTHPWHFLWQTYARGGASTEIVKHCWSPSSINFGTLPVMLYSCTKRRQLVNALNLTHAYSPFAVISAGEIQADGCVAKDLIAMRGEKAESKRTYKAWVQDVCLNEVIKDGRPVLASRPVDQDGERIHIFKLDGSVDWGRQK
eukprot:1460696-Amphidinium_carterae.1